MPELLEEMENIRMVMTQYCVDGAEMPSDGDADGEFASPRTAGDLTVHNDRVRNGQGLAPIVEDASTESSALYPYPESRQRSTALPTVVASDALSSDPDNAGSRSGDDSSLTDSTGPARRRPSRKAPRPQSANAQSSETSAVQAPVALVVDTAKANAMAVSAPAPAATTMSPTQASIRMEDGDYTSDDDKGADADATDDQDIFGQIQMDREKEFLGLFFSEMETLPEETVTAVLTAMADHLRDRVSAYTWLSTIFV